jgi:hypothetical protein
MDALTLYPLYGLDCHADQGSARNDQNKFLGIINSE